MHCFWAEETNVECLIELALPEASKPGVALTATN
jgi:hypothetical protein